MTAERRFGMHEGLLTYATLAVRHVAALGAGPVIDYKTEDICQAVRDWSARERSRRTLPSGPGRSDAPYLTEEIVDARLEPRQ